MVYCRRYTGCVADESREVHQRRRGDSLLLDEGVGESSGGTPGLRRADFGVSSQSSQSEEAGSHGRQVRRAARELSIIPEQIAAEVAAVRRERARRS